jgi:hypothetical protein
MVITSNLHLIILKRDLNKELYLKTKPFNDCFLITDGVLRFLLEDQTNLGTPLVAMCTKEQGFKFLRDTAKM